MTSELKETTLCEIITREKPLEEDFAYI